MARASTSAGGVTVALIPRLASVSAIACAISAVAPYFDATDTSTFGPCPSRSAGPGLVIVTASSAPRDTGLQPASQASLPWPRTPGQGSPAPAPGTYVLHRWRHG